MSVISVYAVFADKDEADRIGRLMVEQRLAACVNILGQIRSIYRWKGKVETSDEIAAIFKTSEEKAGDLMTRIAALHSYEIPCIVTWPIEQIVGSYADWVEASLD